MSAYLHPVTGSTINHDSEEEDVVVASPNDLTQITIASSGAFREECLHLISFNSETQRKTHHFDSLQGLK